MSAQQGRIAEQASMEDQQTLRGLTIRYVVALGLVGALSLAAFTLLSTLISSQKSDGPTINVSGRQRMLSQRIAAFALRFSHSKTNQERELSRKALKASISLMRASHVALAQGSESMNISPRQSAAVKRLYFEPGGLDQTVPAYLDHAQVIADATGPVSPNDRNLQAILTMSQKPLLAQLNAAVKQYERESSRVVFNLHRAELGIVCTTLVLLLLEGLLIFRPLVRRLKNKLHEVRESQARLNKRDHAMQQVLDSMGDGILSVSISGEILPERSAAIERWFGPAAEGTDVWTWLFEDDADHEKKMMKLGFRQLVQGIMPMEVALDQLPNQTSRGDRVFEIEYRPTLEQDELSAVLIIVRDVTERLRREQVEAQMREIYRTMGRIARDPNAFRSFIGEASELVDGLSRTVEDRVLLLRTLHTLKGNAGVYGLDSFVSVVHEAESAVRAMDGSDRTPIIKPVEEAWEGVLNRLEAFITSDSTELIELFPKEYEAYLKMLSEDPSYAELLPVVKSWRHAPAERPLQKLADAGRRLAEQHGKQANFQVDGGGVRLPRARFAALWRSMVHVVRNAVDHGIESDEQGEVVLKAARGAEETVISVSDNGPGIDWARLQQKAEALGLPFRTKHEQLAVLFRDGVSTREVATTVSGRGVGTAAVLQEVEALGGYVDVISETGKGTVFEFAFPNQATRSHTVDMGGTA